MNRRRFQFSLRAAIVTMLLAGVGIGVYIRLPYYRAAKALDEAEGEKSSPGWQIVRTALINNGNFRESVRSQVPLRVAAPADSDEFYVFGMSKVWRINASVENGVWKIHELVGMPYLH